MTDPNPMHPDLRAAYKYLPVLPYQHPLLIPLGRAMYNKTTRTKAEIGVDIIEENIGTVNVRYFRPLARKNGSAVLWIHGGGLVAGTSEQLDAVASRFAKRLRATVVSVRYRWAPEHPFPAALDDLVTAWHWMQAQAGRLGLDPQRFAIVGQSAGGGLAASLVQRLFDLGGVQPVAQVLHYPMLDDRVAADRQLDRHRYKLWTNRCNRTAWNAYLKPHRTGDLTLPPYAAAARRQDLSGLPPAWIGVGSADLFFHETKTYAERLAAAGVACETMVVDGAPHVFEIMAPDWDQSVDFMARSLAFLKAKLTPPKTTG